MNTYTDAFPDVTDQPLGYITGATPVLKFGQFLTLFLPDATPEQAAAWLRALSATCGDLAEQVELTARPGLALAERHIAEAKAAAGIGGQR